MTKATYKDAGVDLDLYQKAMSSIHPLLEKPTWRKKHV